MEEHWPWEEVRLCWEWGPWRAGPDIDGLLEARQAEFTAAGQVNAPVA